MGDAAGRQSARGDPNATPPQFLVLDISLNTTPARDAIRTPIGSHCGPPGRPHAEYRLDVDIIAVRHHTPVLATLDSGSTGLSPVPDLACAWPHLDRPSRGEGARTGPFRKREVRFRTCPALPAHPTAPRSPGCDREHGAGDAGQDWRGPRRRPEAVHDDDAPACTVRLLRERCGCNRTR